MTNVPFIKTNYGVILVNEKTGFSQISEQVKLNSIEAGFALNILILGRRGLGTTTLINSIFGVPLLDKHRSDEITTTTNEIIENEIKLKVSVTSYHNDDFGSVEKFIHDRNAHYFEHEQGIFKKFEDLRIHVCLYLIPFDKMTANEIEGLKNISNKCNLIPIISKADMYTQEELMEVRDKVYNVLKDNSINVFAWENFDKSSERNIKFPLATIASEKSYDFEGRIIRGRRYLWGFIDIENDASSDFNSLQQILVYSNHCDLIWNTDTIFYNNFRKSLSKDFTAEMLKEKLQNFKEQLEKVLEEKQKLKIERLQKEEADMIAYFTEKIKMYTNRNRLNKDIE